MNITKRKDELHGLPPKPAVSTVGSSPTTAPAAGSPRPTQWERQHHNGQQVRPWPISVAPASANGNTEDHRPGKRTKKGAGDGSQTPSLLSRMGGGVRTPDLGGTGVAKPVSEPSIPAKRRLLARSDPSDDPDKDPVGGYSIKGAARAVNRPSPSKELQPRSSLLERMQEDEAGGRKRKRTKP